MMPNGGRWLDRRSAFFLLTRLIEPDIIGTEGGDIMPNMVTIAEAAQTLGCSKANVYQKIKRYGIPTQKKPLSVRSYTVRVVHTQHVDLEELIRISEGSKSE